MSANSVPKTAKQMDEHLEDCFFERNGTSHHYGEFLGEYFDLTPRGDLPQCLFPLADIVAVNRGFGQAAARGPAPAGKRGAGPKPAVAPITNRGVTLYKNAGPTSSQHTDIQNVTESPRILGGYDGGVEVGFNGRWQDDSFHEAREWLEEGLKEAQAKGNGKKFLCWAGRNFTIQPFGGGKGVHYRYIIEGGGTKAYIHQNPEGDLQPVRVRYGAEALIGRDLFSVHKRFRDWLDAVGFQVAKETVSRADLQIMVERPVGEFFRLINSRRVMTKAGKWASHGRHGYPETFSLGSEIEICIYDKGRETLKLMASRPVKFLLMVLCCFGEDWLVDSRPITRIEFRLWRGALKAKGVDSMRDLQEIEPTLVEWLTTRWFRLLKDEKRRGRENKQEVSPIWREVQERFREYFPGVGGVRREIVPVRKKPLACSADQLLKQAGGCMASALAILHGIQDDAKQCGDLAAELMRSLAERIHERSVERAAEIAIARE